MTVAGLVFFVEIHGAGGSGYMTTICGSEGETAGGIEMLSGAVVAKEDFGAGGCRFPAPISGGGHEQMAEVVVAFKLAVLGMEHDQAAFALRIQFHGVIEHEVALLRI